MKAEYYLDGLVHRAGRVEDLEEPEVGLAPGGGGGGPGGQHLLQLGLGQGHDVHRLCALPLCGVLTRLN